MATWADSWWKRTRRDFARRTSKENLAAHVAYLGMLVRELPHTCGKSFTQGVRARRTAVLSFARTRRHCLGSDWRGDRLLRNGAGIRKIARTIWPPNCGLPISATKTRLDGAGDYQGAIIGVASHTHDGDGLGASRPDLAREAKQRLDGAGMRAEGARHPWRRRHHRSLPRDPPSHESGNRLHLRGTHDIHTLVIGRDITGINAFGG